MRKYILDKSREPVVAFHGVRKMDINKDIKLSSVYFTDDIEIARSYAGKDGFILRCKLRADNVLVIDAGGSKWSDMKFKERKTFVKACGTRWITPADVVDYARKNGFDGVVIQNVIDDAYNRKASPATDYIVFHKDQIEPVDQKTSSKK